MLLRHTRDSSIWSGEAIEPFFTAEAGEEGLFCIGLHGVVKKLSTVCEVRQQNTFFSDFCISRGRFLLTQKITYMEMEYIDYKTSEDRLGDYVHNPTKKELIEMLSKAILGGLLIGMVALAFSTVLTWKSVADKEYANAHAFIPVHRN